jgi:hypothetical protein
MGTALPLIFAVIFVMLGAAVLYFGARNQRKAEESRSWPTAPGRIIESRLIESTSTDNDGMTSTSYKPSIRYTYEVGGKKLQGERLNRGMSMAYDAGTARGIMARYPMDAAVTVYYNPSAPAEAALETSARGGTVIKIVGIVMIAVGVLCGLSGLVMTVLGSTLQSMMGY